MTPSTVREKSKNTLKNFLDARRLEDSITFF